MTDKLLFCPKCGNAAPPERIKNSCVSCGSFFLETDMETPDFKKISLEESKALSNYILHKFAEPHPLFDRKAYEDRINLRSPMSLPRAPKIKCPSCGSEQIQLVQRKWSIFTGFLTNKVDRVCVNCKHRF